MADSEPPAKRSKRPRNVLLAEFEGLAKEGASQALRDTGGDLDKARALLDESGGDATKARTSMMGYTLAYVAEEMPELYAATPPRSSLPSSDTARRYALWPPPASCS